MTNTNTNIGRKYNRHAVVFVIIAIIVVLLAIGESFASAGQSSLAGASSSVASSMSASLASSVRSSDTPTILREAAQYVSAVTGGATNSLRTTASVASSQKAATVMKTKSVASTVRSFFSIVGRPKEGQVLMYVNGKLQWQDLTSPSTAPAQGSVHVSGSGRKPVAYPINAQDVLHSAAGAVSPERHYGGGGGRNSTSDNGGSTTVVNNYYTTNNSGTGSSGATFIGTTPTTSYNGSFVSASKTGYDAGNALCDAAFTGSHMCRTDEILDTIVRKDIATLFSGVADAWIAEGPPGYTADSNDCRGWTSSNLAHLGPWWDFSTSGGGVGYLTNCSTTKPIACCKVQ